MFPGRFGMVGGVSFSRFRVSPRDGGMSLVSGKGHEVVY